MDSTKLSPDCRAILSKKPLGPAGTLKRLREALAAEWSPPGYCVHDYKAVETSAQFRASLQDYYGLGQLGPIACKNRYGHREFREGARILVHWPTLLRQATDLAFQKPALALFLLGFRDVIGLKSPFVLESLIRNYRMSVHEISAQSQDKPYTATASDLDLPTVFPAEVAALDRHLARLASDTPFIRTLQQVCAQTYHDVPANQALKHLARYFRGIDPAHRKDCSMLVLAGPLPGAAEFAAPIPQRPESPQDFACGHLNWILNELWVAHHLGQYQEHGGQSRNSWVQELVKPLGVFSGQNYLIINWELWVGYRNKLKLESTYVDYVYPRNTPKFKQRKTSRLKTLLTHVAQRLWLDYPSLTASPLVITDDFRKKFDALWGSGWSQGDQLNGLTNSTVINLDALRRLTHLRYKQALGRGTTKAVSHITERRVNYEHLYYFFTVSTVDPNTMYNVSYDCTAIHTGRKTYFQPSWDLSDAKIYTRPRPALGETHFVSSARKSELTKHTADVDKGPPVRYPLRPGVIRIDPDDKLAYSVDVLLDPDFSDTAPRTTEIVMELRRIAAFRRKDFLKLSPVSDDSDSKPKTRNRRSSWTFIEDLTVERLYRPDMSDEDRAKLKEVCPTRTPIALSNRARDIRRKLIDKGVYDLKDLPHGQYNHKIRLEISAAQKAASKK